MTARHLVVLETEGAEFVSRRARRSGWRVTFLRTSAGSRWAPPPSDDQLSVVELGHVTPDALEARVRSLRPDAVLSMSLLEAECRRDADLARRLAGGPDAIPMLAAGPVEAIDLITDKAATRRRLAAEGLPVVGGAQAVGPEQALAVAEQCGYPLVLKPLAGFAGQGLRLVRTPSELAEVCGRRASRPYLVEPFVPGSEVAVELILWSGRVLAQPPVYKGRTRLNLFEHPAYRPRICPWTADAEAAQLQQLAERCAVALGLQGLMEFEFIVDERGTARLLEVNPGPAGLSRICSAASSLNTFEALTALALGEAPLHAERGSSGVALWLSITRPLDAALTAELLLRPDVLSIEPVGWMPLLPLTGNVLLRADSTRELRETLRALAPLTDERYLREALEALDASQVSSRVHHNPINRGEEHGSQTG